jgi:hypothetical protein
MHPRHPPATPRPATTPRSPCVTDRQHDPGYSNFQEPVILGPAELDLHYRLAVPRLERGHIRLRNMSIPVRISLNSRCLAMSSNGSFTHWPTRMSQPLSSTRNRSASAPIARSCAVSNSLSCASSEGLRLRYHRARYLWGDCGSDILFCRRLLAGRLIPGRPEGPQRRSVRGRARAVPCRSPAPVVRGVPRGDRKPAPGRRAPSTGFMPAPVPRTPGCLLAPAGPLRRRCACQQSAADLAHQLA